MIMKLKKNIYIYILHTYRYLILYRYEIIPVLRYTSIARIEIVHVDSYHEV